MLIPPRWLVLGAGSWLGYLLCQQLADTRAQVLGTIHHQRPGDLPPSIKIMPAESVESYLGLTEDYSPNIVINFLRGEDATGYSIHTAMADYCRRNGVLYIYLSSVLALDGYLGTELREELPPRSLSPYGQFKAQCEAYLTHNEGDFLILRFSSAQGWVPHKPTRNETFLSKISRGETVTVDTGVIQNRLAADLLMEAIRALVHRRVTGVIHLGATDASEELEFLRYQAALFGWNPKLVIPGRPRPINLRCLPGKIFQIFGSRFQRSEAQTLDYLIAHPGLQRWRNVQQI